MNDKYAKESYYLLLILTFIAVSITLSIGKNLFIPFTFSVFIYYSIAPLIRFIQLKLKLQQNISIFLSLLLVVFILSLLIAGISFSAKSFIVEIDVYRQKFILMADQIRSFAATYDINLEPMIGRSQISKLPIFGVFKNISSSIAQVFGDMTLVGLFLLFLFLGPQKKVDHKSTMGKISYGIGSYTVSKITISFATGLVSWGIMAAFGLDLALMFAILAFLLNFIPSVGSLIAVMVPVPIAFLQFGIGGQSITLLVLLGLTQFFFGNILEPKIMGKGLGLHPIVVMLSLIFWATVWGVAGMFLAVPLTASLKIIFEEIPSTKKLAKVLSGQI